jgi:hypothetical protein
MKEQRIRWWGSIGMQVIILSLAVILTGIWVAS